MFYSVLFPTEESAKKPRNQRAPDCFSDLQLDRILKAVLTRALNRMARLDPPIRNLIIKLVTTLMWALTIIIVAGAFGINATSLVAVLSVAGLAFSLSVQNLLTNFFSGIMLLINKPFKEGDFVEIGDKVGTIKNIGFFSVLNCCLLASYFCRNEITLDGISMYAIVDF